MLIKACLNGGVGRNEHDAVPLTPEELGRDARASIDAGAGAIHLHPRATDGRETLDPATTAAAVEAVRAACPGAPVGVTTILTVTGGVQDRAALVAGWTTLPDFASVNVSEPGAQELAGLLLERGVGVEWGLVGPEDARVLAGWELAPRCVRVLVEVPEADPSAAVAAAAATADVLAVSGIAAPQLHHGDGHATWAVLAAAVRRGHDIRIGLEDTRHLPDGRRAAGNAELVAEAAALVEAATRRAGPGP